MHWKLYIFKIRFYGIFQYLLENSVVFPFNGIPVCCRQIVKFSCRWRRKKKICIRFVAVVVCYLFVYRFLIFSRILRKWKIIYKIEKNLKLKITQNRNTTITTTYVYICRDTFTVSVKRNFVQITIQQTERHFKNSNFFHLPIQFSYSSRILRFLATFVH